MKKKILIFSLIALGAITAIGVSASSSQGWFRGHMANLSPEEAAEKQEAMFEAKANFFGVSVEELKNLWAEGKNWQEIAEELGISKEEMQTKMQAEMKLKMQEHLQAFVDKGVITQEQADERLQTMEERRASGDFGRGMKRGPKGDNFKNCPCQESE